MFVDVGLQRRLLGVGFDAGGRGLLLQVIVLHLHAEVDEAGLGGLQLQFGIVQFLLEGRIAQFENHRVGAHRGAGPEHDSLYPADRRRRNPADVLWNERAQAADLADHRAPFDRVDPDGRALDARGGGLQA